MSDDVKGDVKVDVKGDVKGDASDAAPAHSRATGRGRSALATALRDPLLWATAALAGLVLGMARLEPLFEAIFPALDRPLYAQDSFAALFVAHVGIVGVSSSVAVLVGVAAGLWVTRPAGREFRPLVEALVAAGQTVPPVAVLAIAAPLVGYGEQPALIALALYGLLPVLRGTIAGIQSVPAATLEAAAGLGLNGAQRLWRVELPLALPVLLAGVRSSVVINIGTAAIASTVGAKTLGSPIIVGLSGFNTAYVVQGALVVGLLAVVVDAAFERLQTRWMRWQAPGPVEPIVRARRAATERSKSQCV